jgi:hypothetical protein
MHVAVAKIKIAAGVNSGTGREERSDITETLLLSE